MKKLLLMFASTLCVATVNAQQRVPLLEVFTSSTCPPCKPGNQVFESVISGKPANEFVALKYQQNFPGSGDPYCTDETVSRRSGYYLINSIPRMEIDGGWDQNAQSFTNSLYLSAKAVAPKFDITGVHTYNNVTKAFAIKVKYKPLDASVLSSQILFCAIVEKETKNNVKTNGETIFYDVVKKMLPTQNGTPLSGLVANQWDSTILNYTFNGSYRLPADGSAPNRINTSTEHSVEDFNNLYVVAWVQGPNKMVQQAAHIAKANGLSITTVESNLSEISLYPNPTTSFVTLNVNMKSKDQITVGIYNMQGALVASHNKAAMAGENTMIVETSSLANGAYNVVVTDSKNNSSTQRLFVTH